MEVLSGTGCSLRVVFQDKYQTLVPDSGSVKLNLRSHNGTLLITDQTITVPNGENSVSINIAGSNNTLSGGQKFASRTAHITYQVGGQTYHQYYPYRVIPWLNHSVTEDKVRFALGVNSNDLPDEAIDITRAYYQAEARLAEDSLTIATELASGTLNEVRANEVILCTAALEVLPSLRLSVSQKEDNGALSFARFAQAPEWDVIEEKIRNRLASALEELANTATSASTLLTFATRTDPVTGA